ncbi:t-SNARE domain-containing protein 1-like [Dreissena polymorpha]|nr:t-SNARE domain-containing protein 1-like [Dreissena polymorpha]
MAARSSNWTKEETEILVNGYVANREALFGKFSSTITNEEKEKTFCAILESINAVGGHGRSIEDLKSKWKQLKCRTVAKARKNHKEVQKTGGGEPVKGLNTVQEKVLSCVPKVVLDGLKGNDTGHIVNPENDRFTASQTDLKSQAVADEARSTRYLDTKSMSRTFTN